MARVEARTAAEVVVVVRERSGLYVHADLVVGIAAGYVTLWFQLFSPWEFSLVAIQAAPAGVGLLAGLATEWVPSLQRLLTPRRVRERYVRASALATVLERDVDSTRDRTGILVYVSHLEKAAEVVADRGLAGLAATPGWTRATDLIRRAAAEGSATELAAGIVALGETVAPFAPRRTDDVDELAHAVEIA